MGNNTRCAWSASLFCRCHAFHTRILRHCKAALLSRGESMVVLRSTVTFHIQKSVLLLQFRIEKALYFKLQIVFTETSRKYQAILPRCFKFSVFSVLNSAAALFREVGCIHAVSLVFLVASRARNTYDSCMLTSTSAIIKFYQKPFCWGKGSFLAFTDAKKCGCPVQSSWGCKWEENLLYTFTAFVTWRPLL